MQRIKRSSSEDFGKESIWTVARYEELAGAIGGQQKGFDEWDGKGDSTVDQNRKVQNAFGF